MTISRRRLLELGIASSAAAVVGVTGFPGIVRAASKRVVVVGGGVGGATAAKYIKMFDPSAEVTVIEPSKEFYTCFMSNEVIGGLRDMETLKFGYGGLGKRGVKVVHAYAKAIDGAGKKVTLENGETIGFDACVVSPGVTLKFDAIGGLSEAATEKIPHAWKAGPQTLLLKKQLEAMDDGGVFIISAPPDPFRCPPGPYERASLAANYFKQKKPKSKVLILDSKEKFAKEGLFKAGWKQLYGDMVEWVPPSKEGTVKRIDVDAMTVYAGELEGAHKGSVINVIPPQAAGRIALDSGLANDKGWCPINPATFESTLQKGVYVIGDACAAPPMPKSAYSANSQAKVCAAAVVAALNGSTPPTPAYTNTCYSLIGPDYGVSVAAVYKIIDGKLDAVKGAGGTAPAEASAEFRKREAIYGHSWFANVTDDIFG